jgi:hypothetical protein
MLYAERNRRQRDILAPTDSLAPGATPGGWTQASGWRMIFGRAVPIITMLLLVFSMLEDSGRGLPPA